VTAEPDFPRVTQVLGQVVNLSWLDPLYLELATQRGTVVHQACELIDGGGDGSGLNWESLDPTIDGYCHSYRSFIEEWEFEPKTLEQLVVSNRYRYKGHLDRTGKVRFPGTKLEKVDCLIDLKSGPPRPSTALQTAAYLRAYRDQTQDTTPRKRFSVHLDRDGGKARVVPYEDPADIYDFLALLQVYRWRERHRMLGGVLQ